MNDFEYSNEIGSIYQDIVSKELSKVGFNLNNFTSKRFQLSQGENAIGIEIKHDSKINETKRFYFEYSAINKNGNKFIDGGITKNDLSWGYLIGDGSGCYLFAKNQLNSLFSKVAKNQEQYKQKFGILLTKHIDKDTNETTSYGMCIPIEYAMNNCLCIKHFKFERNYEQWLKVGK